MEKIDMLFLVLMLVGSFFVLKRGFREWDREGYYSINIKLILAGFTMLIIAIIMIIQSL
jgi:hypothetical protein